MQSIIWAIVNGKLWGTGQYLSGEGIKKTMEGWGEEGTLEWLEVGLFLVFVINEKELRGSVFSGYARSKKLFVFVWPSRREIQKMSQKVESCQGSK